MPDHDSLSTPPTPRAETALRRVWQPPQAKAVEVEVVTRSTVTGSGYDGAYCNS